MDFFYIKHIETIESAIVGYSMAETAPILDRQRMPLLFFPPINPLLRNSTTTFAVLFSV